MSTMQPLPEWNDTATNYPQNKCIHQLFEEQVELTPDKIAIVFEDQHLTYRELNNKSNQLAHHLISIGVKPETLVGICIERSLEIIIGILGILKAGGAYVPLDPSYPQERLFFMLMDSKINVLLTQQDLVKIFSVQELKLVCLDTDCEMVSKQIETNPNNVVKPENLAYIIYTSGSTGKPKGVAVSQRAVNRLVFNTNYVKLISSDNMAQVSNTSFDAATFEIWGALLHGAKLVVINKNIAISPQEFVTHLNKHEISVIFLTTALFNQLAHEIPTVFKSVRVVLFGGEVCDPSCVARILKYGPPQKLLHVYGPTENTTFSSWYLVKEVPENVITIPIGSPISNSELFILDKYMQKVPIGVSGELHTGGAGLARGYLNRPELTAEKFIPNPFSTESDSRLYKTGDLARYLPDGNIEFLGRIDNQVKIRGFRIELGEIEAKLHQHPDIRDAVIIAREDTPGDKKLVAYLVAYQLAKQRVPMHSSCTIECQVTVGDDNKTQEVHTEDISYGGIGIAGLQGDCQLGQRFILSLKLPDMQDGETLTVEGNLVWLGNNGYAGIQFDSESTNDVSLRNKINNYFEQQGILKVLQNTFIDKLTPFLLSSLPDYMVPAHFVILDELPLTPNGKIDRNALPAPDLTRPDLYTAVEETLTKIWAKILGLERVGLHDNFLRLGGNSLLATKIIVQVNELFQLELPPYILFEVPTIAELAERVETPLHESASLQIPPIESVTNHTNTPLSFSQQQLWLLTQFEPDVPVYNEPFTISLGGPINVNILKQSIDELLQRHSSLRTTFTIDETGQPIQIISPIIAWNLSIIDLSKLPANKKEDEYIQLATQEAKRPFDLANDSLFRITLLQLSETDYRLCLTLHHIIFDGVSLYNILFPELAILYQTFIIGKPSPLPKLTIQYADYVLWQRQWLKKDVIETCLDYWKKQLVDLPVLQLSTDRPRTSIQTYTGARYCFSLTKKLTDALKEFSQQEGVTIFITLLTAFKILLYRYSGQVDFPVGTVASGRKQAEIEKLIGIFLNTLVLRTDLSGNPNFKGLLNRVQKVTLDAYANENLPFEILVKTLCPERNLGANPLFQVAFVFEPSLSDIALDWTINQYDIHTGTSKFDLTLLLDKRKKGIIGYIEYNTDLFDDATIIRMAGHYQTLLESIVINPELCISNLPLLTQQEQQQIRDWNNAPLDICIHHLFEAQVERTPNLVAIVCEDKKITYQELNCRANQLAHYLKTLDIEPDVLIGIYMERSLELIVGLLAILKVGGAYVPLDPTQPPERLSFMIEDAQMPVLLTYTSNLNFNIRYKTQIVNLDDVLWQEISKMNSDNLLSQVMSHNLAYVIYTSGSTGKPKGVLVTHHNVIRLFRSTQPWFNFNEQDVWTFFHSYAFDFSVWEIWGALSYGGRLVVVSYLTSRAPEAFYELLINEQVTILNQTPSAFYQLIRIDESLQQKLSLRLIIFGGEALELQNLKPWFKRHGDTEPQLVNMYGITETTVHVTYRPLTMADSDETSSVIGIPIPDLQLYVLDQTLQPVPIGVPGEIYVGGAGVSQGYLNRQELTAERFIKNPDDSKSNLYKTGDLACYQPNGDLKYLGRIDQQVQLRGFRIELGEIESILNQHAIIQDTVVIVREDVIGDKRLIAYFTSKQKYDPDIKELRQFMLEKLPDYMIPSTFVLLDKLPLTTNGKIDRKALPKPEGLHRNLHTSHIAPQNELEQTIAQIWQELLQIKKVGIEDTFFDLGGHSLLIVQLQEQLKQILNQSIPITILFQYPTIKTLVQYLSSQSESNIKSSRATKQQAAILRQKLRKTR